MQNRRCVERERCGTGVHGRSFPYAGCRGGFRFGRCRSGRQRKNESRMKRRVHAGYAAICAACVLFHAACGRWSGAPWYLDRAQLQTDYLAAVADAAVSDASEVYRDLPCIVSPDSGDGLEWTERGGRQFVLVCSMTDGEYAGVWTAGRQFVTDGYTLWVVLPYELEERMRRMPLMGDSLECRMRMLQLLGLPPDSPYDRLLFSMPTAVRCSDRVPIRTSGRVRLPMCFPATCLHRIGSGSRRGRRFHMERRIRIRGHVSDIPMTGIGTLPRGGGWESSSFPAVRRSLPWSR